MPRNGLELDPYDSSVCAVTLCKESGPFCSVQQTCFPFRVSLQVMERFKRKFCLLGTISSWSACLADCTESAQGAEEQGFQQPHELLGSAREAWPLAPDKCSRRPLSLELRTHLLPLLGEAAAYGVLLWTWPMIHLTMFFSLLTPQIPRL